MAAVAITPRPQPLLPRPVWTHDSHLAAAAIAHMATPSNLARMLDVSADVFTASAPARMAARTKRAREDTHTDAAQPPAAKRACATPTKTRLMKQLAKADREKLERREKRQRFEAQEREFREKYIAAFPKWTFHFDSLDTATVSTLTQRVMQLGARVDTFFSKKVSHVITMRPIPPDAKLGKGASLKDISSQTALSKRDLDKENVAPQRSSQPGQRLSQTQSQQPWKAGGRPALAPLARKDGNLHFDDSNVSKNDLLTKALHFGMKVWSVEKLTSVLDRIQLPASPHDQTPNLSNLLADERLHGTRERDPNALRPDYTYFQRNSYFLLVEDISGEHCPIMMKQYERPARGERSPWPFLYADKNASGPFSPGYEQSSEEKPLAGLAETAAAPAPRPAPAPVMKVKRPADLRKVLSMNNLKRAGAGAAVAHATPDASHAGQHEHDKSAYIAASGNSVTVTSAVATSARSATGAGLPGTLAHTANRQLQERLRQQVLTNRLATTRAGEVSTAPALRKSKSTNTLKLPMREETKKPGYCENCRIKFADFSQHVKSKKHRNFATSYENFLSLDEVLERLRRPLASERLDIERELAMAEDDYDSNVPDEELDISGIYEHEQIEEDEEVDEEDERQRREIVAKAWKELSGGLM